MQNGRSFRRDPSRTCASAAPRISIPLRRCVADDTYHELICPNLPGSSAQSGARGLQCYHRCRRPPGGADRDLTSQPSPPKAAAANALAPVAGLPVELLSEVFLTASVIANEENSLQSITLSHVSPLWRTVALEIRKLWNKVDNLTMLHEFASRSGYLPLHLELSVMSEDTSLSDTVLTPVIASRLSTWSVHNISPNPHPLQIFPQFVASIEEHASLTNLDKLALSDPGSLVSMEG